MYFASEKHAFSHAKNMHFRTRKYVFSDRKTAWVLLLLISKSMAGDLKVMRVFSRMISPVSEQCATLLLFIWRVFRCSLVDLSYKIEKQLQIDKAGDAILTKSLVTFITPRNKWNYHGCALRRMHVTTGFQGKDQKQKAFSSP